MTFSYLSAHDLPIAVQARLSGRSRSSFYYKPKQPEKDAKLLIRIRFAHETNPFYGCKRLAHELDVNHKRVYRLMRLHGIRAKSSRKKRGKNQYSSSKISLPNVLKDLALTKPNQVWAGDFTHFAWKHRTLYLATPAYLMQVAQIIETHAAGPSLPQSGQPVVNQQENAAASGVSQ